MSCYFIELYLDNLRDLLFAMENPRGNPPKLEIKLDANKMVVVKNVVVKVGVAYRGYMFFLFFFGGGDSSLMEVLKKTNKRFWGEKKENPK